MVAFSFICLRIFCYFPLLALKGIYHYCFFFTHIFPRGLSQMEVLVAEFPLLFLVGDHGGQANSEKLLPPWSPLMDAAPA